MSENLMKMENFFYRNLAIKELIYHLTPDRNAVYDKFMIYEYVDKYLKALDRIKMHFFSILDSFPFEADIKKMIDKNFKKYEKKILTRIRGFDDLNRIYGECFTNMDNDLIDEVKGQFIGYLFHNQTVANVFLKSQTINEMLHVLHSAVVNNEHYYKSMPLVDEKENDEGYPVVLYGREEELSRKLFNDFPLAMSAGDVDIIALEKNILMMIRDRGHALSIQIEIDTNNTIWVKYFIPKICNVDMVNALKGVNKVDKNSRFTNGVFTSTKENLSIDIIDFIGMVPMDYDMEIDYLKGR